MSAPGSALPVDYHFEILARNDERAVLGDVELIEQSVEIGLERLACLRTDRGDAFKTGPY